MTTKVVLALSGGLDSAVLLAELLQTHDKSEVLCMSFNYGAKHCSSEEKASQQLMSHYEVLLRRITLTDVFLECKSTLMDLTAEIPQGHHEDPKMKSTVVPCRNMIFASVLSSVADSLGANKIALGMHAGDRAIYPDCRLEFVTALESTVKFATDGRVKVFAPFIDWQKKQIVAHGAHLKVPFEKTWSCYVGGDRPCGRCAACTERNSAFAELKLIDPL